MNIPKRKEIHIILYHVRKMQNCIKNTSNWQLALKRVHFAGRLATYKYYNMDQVVAQSLTLFKTIHTPTKETYMQMEMEQKSSSCRPEIWGGIECTINRVGDTYRDQLDISGHYERPGDIDMFGGLGIKKLRYPVLWEKHQPTEETSLTGPGQKNNSIRSGKMIWILL